MKTKTTRQLNTIYHNNAPQSTSWLQDKSRALALHRAAWAELLVRRAEASAFSDTVCPL